MNERCYIGIDRTDKNEWLVALWSDGKTTFSRPFLNTPAELEALRRFITDRCQRPKICLNLASPGAFELLSYLSGIAGVEVVLMSNAGLRLQLSWLPKESVQPTLQTRARRAYWLACCAERMI